jgi:hypothetical protein
MNVGDFIATVLCGLINQQQWCNVFYWVVDVAPAVVDWSLITAKFVSEIVSKIQSLQDNTVPTTQVAWYEATDNQLMSQDALNLYGGLAAAGEAGAPPPFLALGYRMGTSAGKTRDGQKRIAGVSERVFQGTGVASAYAPQVLALGNALAQPLAANAPAQNAFSLWPVVVGRDTEGKLDFNRFDLITQFVRANPTTQNSRKVGKGR